MPSPKETVAYVTRDIERALGMLPEGDYHVVTNRTSYGESLEKQHPKNVTLVDVGHEGPAGTGDLMDAPATAELFARLERENGAKPHVLIFKNTARIEPIAKAHGWIIVNPSAALSEKIENKISQVMWLGEAARFLPVHRIKYMKNVAWSGKQFILQWAHGHTGGGTILVKSEQEITDLKARFPERRCRVSDYIEGPSFTLNVVAAPDKILPSSISYQITGLEPFTDSPFATVGNDWGLATKLLTPEDKSFIVSLAMDIGAKMQKEQWRGLFGVDVVKERATGKIYLIEVNARQPASTTFESHLQEEARAQGASGITTFEAHLEALLRHKILEPLIVVTDGAQIVQRITKALKSVPSDVIGSLELGGFTAIPYENTGENSDLLRIQSKAGIMSDDNALNSVGAKIAAALKI